MNVHDEYEKIAGGWRRKKKNTELRAKKTKSEGVANVGSEQQLQVSNSIVLKITFSIPNGNGVRALTKAYFS